MIKSVELLLSGAATKRFHTVPTLNTETIGHHTALVAGLIPILFPDCSRALLINAIFHDITECETGDIPSPIKRRLGIDLSSIEQEIVNDAGLFLPELTEHERKDLKCADILIGMIECLHERRMGNRLVTVAFNNFFSYFETLDHPNLQARQLCGQICGEFFSI